MAAKSVGDDQGLLIRSAHFRQQDPFAALDRDLVMLSFFEPKGAGHAATTRIQQSIVQPRSFQNLDLVLQSHHRAMMAVSMNQRFAAQFAMRIIGSVADQEFAQEKCLSLEP